METVLASVLNFVARSAAFLVGVWLVFRVLKSAVRTFVLPRSARDEVTRAVFLLVRAIFSLRVRRAESYERRDSIMALFAPIALLVLPVVWMIITTLGFGLMFWATGIEPFSRAIITSISSLETLGFATVDTFPQTILVFVEAILGLTLIALLIAYLPTIYAAFSQREKQVSMLEVRAGTPPAAVELFKRYQRIGGLNDLPDLWATWEEWFTEIDETHTSLAVLPFFRSPHPDRHWVTAAGSVLDAGALYLSTLDLPPTGREPRAALMLRAGFLSLRHIADFFGINHNPDPKPDDPISVRRDEWEQVVAELEAAGIPIKADRDQAWKAFAGWRVNYDTVLLSLAGMTMAPYAPWSSDRSLRPTIPTPIRDLASSFRVGRRKQRSPVSSD